MLETAQPRSQRPRWRYLAVLGALLVPVLGLGVLVAIPAEPEIGPVFGRATPPAERVAIVSLSANRRANRSAKAERALWEDAARASSLYAEQLEVTTLDDLRPSRFGVWVLPQQEVLSEADVAAIDAFLAAGGGIVLSGGSGARSAARQPHRLLPLERFFPEHRFEAVVRTGDELAVASRGPLVVDLAPGSRVPIEPARRALVARGDAGLRWQASGSGALLHGRHRGAPIAWLGFSPERIRDPGKAATLLRNALRYASRRPSIELQAWPHGRAVAALIATDPVGRPEHVERIRKIHATRNVPLLNAALVRGCSNAGRDDPEALGALVAKGCRFAAVSDAPGSAPSVVESAGSGLVVLPRAARLGPVPQAASAGSARRQLLRRELGEYQRVKSLGGLYTLTYDADWIRAPQGPELIDALIGELASHEVWFASGDELASWWLQRRDVHADLLLDGPGTARLVVRNGGREAAHGVTTRVYLPPDSLSPVPDEPRIFGRSRILRVATDRTWVELVTPVLDPGKEVLYTITF